MKKSLYLLIFLLISSSIFSQKETNNWVFGFGNWVDFNNDPVISNFIPGPNFFAEHNTISMSNANGELLFYSDGFSVFNKNNTQMPNGFLTSDFGITNPVYAIPKPNSDHEYYLLINTNGFAGSLLEWKTIDMNLNNGLGDVVDSGQVLLSNTTGQITAVQHSNLTDIWVVAHGNDSDSFFAFLATEDGISDVAVESAVGAFIDLNTVGGSNIGQIKTSPSGNRIAVAHTNLNVVDVFEFNKTTGELYNPITIENLALPYGVEFSPNDRYLYISDLVTPQTTPELAQYDLWEGTPSDINNSMFLINSSISFSASPGGLQLASNGKIYLANPFNFTLGAIHNPNDPGQDINFSGEEIFLTTEILLGLPSFYHVYLQNPFFTYSGFCNGSITEFEIDGFENIIDSVHWDFGDPASGSANFSTALNPTHQYPGSGVYDVVLTLFSGGNFFSYGSQVHIAPTQINLNPDQTVCSNVPVTTGIFIPNGEYLWSNGATSPSIEVTDPGTYTVQITVDTCPVLIDDITISHIPAPDVNLGGNGGLCNGEEVVLDATTPNANSYLWSTGSSTSSITIFFGGLYSVTATNSNGCTDTEEVFYQVNEVILNPSQANLACYEDSSGVALVFLGGGIAPFSYEWDNGDTLYTRNNLAAGNYTITVTDALGCSSTESFTINQPDEIIIDFVVNADNPSTPNPDGQVLIQPSGGTPPFVFDWENFGETDNPLKMGLENGTYSVTVIDDNDCENELLINVGGTTPNQDLSFLEKIELFPNPVNELLFLKLPTDFPSDFSLEIFNPLGQNILGNIVFEKGKGEIEIDVKDWSSGVYFFKIKTKTEERVFRVNVF